MSVVVKGSGAQEKTAKVTLLKDQAGSNATISYTTQRAWPIMIIAAGGYGNMTLNTGTGWTQTHNDTSSSNRAAGWKKSNVASGETVAIKCADRYGIAFYGIETE